MSGRARPPYDPWRDAEGTPIPVSARVEQIAVAPEHGARAPRLHQRGDVICRGGAGRGHLRLYVRFDGDRSASARTWCGSSRGTETVVADSPELAAAKRLLDLAKDQGFVFQRIAPGEDGPLLGIRDTPR